MPNNSPNPPDDVADPDGAAPEADPIALPDLPDIALSGTPLSRGSLSAVYRGWDRVHRCDVIVKVQRRTDNPVAADRFRREAAVMARLRHPNIVTLYRFHDGDPSALVMEYVPGRTLGDLVADDGWLAPAAAARIIEEIAAALDRIHAEDIVHRDVKPGNILLPRRGPARLTDFGVSHVDADAPLTVMGDVLGTIEYASPEQVHGNEAPDARSDVYALAAVAYFALTATPPFRAADASTQAQLSVMHRQVFEQPPPLRFHREDLAPEVEAAVLRGLAKSPASRYPSAGQFAATLRSAVEATSGLPERAAMAATSRRTGARTGVLAGAGLLVGAAALWKLEQPAPVPQAAPRAASAAPAVSTATPTPAVSASSAIPPSARTPAAPARKTASLPAKSTPRAIAPSRPVAQAMLAAIPPAANPPAANPPAARPPARKVAVTERPKHRRHPSVVASAARPALRPKHRRHPSVVASAARPALRPVLHPSLGAAARVAHGGAAGQAWLSVYARQSLALLGRAPRSVTIPARAVLVDGQPVAALAAGGWATLPAGRHLVSYQPTAGSGFAGNPGLWVTLAPGAHLTRQVLLPAAPGARVRLAAAAPAAEQITPPAVGWYSVSGWAAASSGGRPELRRAAADWVKVDGLPVAALASGEWAELPAGKHTVTFQPASGLGVGPKTWEINLAAQAHLDQKVPLPPDPSALVMASAPASDAAPASTPVAWYTVSGWVTRGRAGTRPSLVRMSAQWVKVDGKPVAPLALGQWAELPAGRHTVTFQPTPALGIAPKTWDIDLGAQAHFDQKIPFGLLVPDRL